MKTWEEVYANARTLCSKCRCCPECNGFACKGETPGPGGKGSGRSFIRNVEMLKHVFIQMDTITSNDDVTTCSDFFGHPISLPVFAAPISGIQQNYGADMSDVDYTKDLLEGCNNAGIIAFTGDGMYEDMFRGPLEIIQRYHGRGVPTIKPWAAEHMQWRIDASAKAGVYAIASDIDASGLINLRKSQTPVGFKSVEDLKHIRQSAKVPVILKGILSVKGAKKAMEAGVDGIIVSNHGGRVSDSCLSGIELLEDIVKEVNGRMKIYIDGGFRSGTDIFKALALGADGVLIGRVISQAIIGGHAQGLEIFLQKLQLELKEAMALAGCKTISDIKREHVIVKW